MPDNCGSLSSVLTASADRYLRLTSATVGELLGHLAAVTLPATPQPHPIIPLGHLHQLAYCPLPLISASTHLFNTSTAFRKQSPIHSSHGGVYSFFPACLVIAVAVLKFAPVLHWNRSKYTDSRCLVKVGTLIPLCIRCDPQ